MELVMTYSDAAHLKTEFAAIDIERSSGRPLSIYGIEEFIEY